MNRDIGYATFPDDNRAYVAPVCPVCGSQCGEIYKDDVYGILGCENCVGYEFARDAVEVENAVCESCGKECEYFYSVGSEYVGCENCIREYDADDIDECFGVN